MNLEIVTKIKTELILNFEPAIHQLRQVLYKQEKDREYINFESEKYILNLEKGYEGKDAFLSFSAKRKDKNKFKVKGYGIDCVIPIFFEYVFSPDVHLVY